MTADMDPIGAKIKDLRLSLGMTLEEVGDAVGVGKSTVRKWENGNIANMGRDKIVKLAKVLHTTPSFLLDWKEPKGIPLLGQIAAGLPILAEDNIETYIDVDLKIKADFALTVKGDSMIDANIYDGDIVFIRMQPIVEEGEIAAVLLVDRDTSAATATLKRVYKTPDGLRLVAENKKYDPIVVNQATCDDAKIIGRAVKYITNVR